MAWPLRRVRLSFQAKVLIPVVSIMVLLLVVPTWVMSRRMSAQLESGAAENLRTAAAVFNNLQAIRANNLLLRYRNVPNEPRFKAVAQKSDPETTCFLLRELLEELGGDVVLFANDQGKHLAGVSRESNSNLKQFSSRGADSIQQALEGQPNVGTISVAGRLFDVVSVPATVNENVVGALTIATEIGGEVAKELKQLTHCEIVLLASDRIAAATLARPDLAEELAEPLRDFSVGAFSREKARPAHTRKLTINGEHFMYLSGQLAQTSGEQKLGYVLLSSYQKPLQVLKSTQRTSLWIDLLGLIVSTTLVWILIRRITTPLRQLRDSAEAVGCGDFSRRVEVASRDECGELAAVFNRMTENIEASRAQLEKTVETLKTTQAQLIQSEKLRAIGTLAGGIAHDFNNILGAIIGFTELLLDDVPTQSRTARNLREVLKAGHRAKDLVRQILAFSRQSEPQRTSVPLHAIIDEALKLLRATLPATIQIRKYFTTTADTVLADPTQIHQVLMNLCTNANHAMRDKGGTLTVTLDEFIVPAKGCSDLPQLKPGNYLRVAVADTGHGMEPAVLERIFEPFFTTKPVGEGTGLGLSVVHGIVKDHGGEITVTSQSGMGTTFSIFLPRAEASAPNVATADEPVPGGDERILLVDDEESLVNMMQQKLTRLGYDVVAHRDSIEAWKEFQSAPQRFDLVITDQNMPRLTGADLAKKIVQSRPNLPIILCSGSVHTSGRAKSLCADVRECVLKPVNFSELSRTIRRVLEKKEP